MVGLMVWAPAETVIDRTNLLVLWLNLQVFDGTGGIALNTLMYSHSNRI